MTNSELLQRVEQLNALKRGYRKWESDLKAREQVLKSEPLIQNDSIQNLRGNMKSCLPDHMMPVNVGAFQAVMWPFWFQMDFSFGVAPTVTPATRQTSSFQVTQEAALMIMSISADTSALTTAGRAGPWQIEMRDRQSSRQFNDQPIPLQMIGNRSNPTILPTPFLLMPNAFFDGTLSTFVPVSQLLVGSSDIQLSFFGYRMRVEDAEKVLSTIFS